MHDLLLASAEGCKTVTVAPPAGDGQCSHALKIKLPWSFPLRGSSLKNSQSCCFVQFFVRVCSSAFPIYAVIQSVFCEPLLVLLGTGGEGNDKIFVLSLVQGLQCSAGLQLWEVHRGGREEIPGRFPFQYWIFLGFS